MNNLKSLVIALVIGVLTIWTTGNVASETVPPATVLEVSTELEVIYDGVLDPSEFTNWEVVEVFHGGNALLLLMVNPDKEAEIRYGMVVVDAAGNIHKYTYAHNGTLFFGIISVEESSAGKVKYIKDETVPESAIESIIDLYKTHFGVTVCGPGTGC